MAKKPHTIISDTEFQELVDKLTSGALSPETAPHVMVKGTSYACGSDGFDCNDYTCTDSDSCSSKFRCTQKFTG